MSKEDFAFGKENFILIAISVVIIIIGFMLMSGGAGEGSSFNPAIFGMRRIVVAPVVCMIGFGLMVAAILKKSKDKKAS
jgi:ABC-type transport system involved in multi-copper enzyme maturation permease subunit